MPPQRSFMPSWTESLTAGSLLKPVDPNEPFLLRNKINRALYWVIEKQKSLESYDPAWVLASYEDRDLEYHSTKGFWRGQLEKYFQPIRIRELTPPAKLIPGEIWTHAVPFWRQHVKLKRSDYAGLIDTELFIKGYHAGEISTKLLHERFIPPIKV
jgi:hypothetical protein